MNGFATQAEAASRNGSIGALQDSFRVFNRVSRDLERAYARLESRAAVVEGRLREANRQLADQVRGLGRETEELLGILETIPSGVVVADPAGNVTRVNPAAERILGRPGVELVGRNASTLRGAGGDAVLLLGRASLHCGVTVERRATNLAGCTRHISGSVEQLPDGGHLEILTDVTEVAHLRSQVGRLDTLAALGEMAAGVAHEIRNPMNGVEGFAGLLEKALDAGGPLQADQLRRYADRIRRGVAEVNGIISNLLLWARPERTQFAPVDLCNLVREVRRGMFEQDGSPAPASFEADLPRVVGRVLGDRIKLKLVLGNLVRNAVDAAGATGHVSLSVEQQAGSVSLHVDDDGPGIDPAVRGRLFTPFATTKSSGTGLGLAIVKKLVDLHRGDVVHASSPLGGARFTVSLPVLEATS